MTYPKQLTKIAEDTLSPFLSQIEGLGEGETLRWEDSASALDQFRYCLYSWLYLSGNKSYFKVKRLSPGELILTRLKNIAPRLVSSLSPSQVFVRDMLGGIALEEEVLSVLKEAIHTEELRLEDFEEVLDLWRKKDD